MTDEITALSPQGSFRPSGCYLDTPTYGLAPTATQEAMIEALERWQAGVATMQEYDEAVTRSRSVFSEIVGVEAESVAIGANVSSLVGPVAASIPAGSTVLVPEGEFTSLLFPLLVNDSLSVRTVPLQALAEEIDRSVDVVAFSLVQSANGLVVDPDVIAEACQRWGVMSLVDATHAAGWFRFEPTVFDFVFVAAYKWLLCPRGAAFMSVDTAFHPRPVNAGWYAGEDPWASIYGTPLRLAASARRFDTSPAWLSWIGAVPSLELIANLGVDRIGAHNLALASRLRSRLGMEMADSPIVVLPASDPTSIADADVKVSVREGSVRVGCHLYNSSGDVDTFVESLTASA